jgi:hypothetical protein
MDDVRAVMDAVGASSAALVGAADGGAMSILFAATYPERTFALALLEATPRLAWAPDFPWGFRREEYEEQTQEILSRRIRGLDMQKRMEEAADQKEESDESRARESARRYRLTISPAGVAAFRRMNFDIDVRSVLPAIKVPTLLMHRPESGDEMAQRMTPVATYMAKQIATAEIVAVADPWGSETRFALWLRLAGWFTRARAITRNRWTLQEPSAVNSLAGPGRIARCSFRSPPCLRCCLEAARPLSASRVRRGCRAGAPACGCRKRGSVSFGEWLDGREW